MAFTRMILMMRLMKSIVILLLSALAADFSGVRLPKEELVRVYLV